MCPCWISPDNLQEGFPRVVSQRVTLFRGAKYFVTPAILPVDSIWCILVHFGDQSLLALHIPLS